MPVTSRRLPDNVITSLPAWLSGVLLPWAALTGAAAAAEPLTAPDFTSEVAPLLASRCSRCHGASEAQGGLRLDFKKPAFLGGDSGAAIVAGRSEESLLIERISAADPDVRMPPAGAEPLSVEEIGLLRGWIDAGAVWPDEDETKGKHMAHRHWAFRSPQRPDVPDVRNAAWPRGPIDRFVLARLEAQGIEPSPEADPTTLLRRVHMDLLGLPPSPQTVERFMREMQPDWYERLVETLLDSPHFGERWARHWLDLARYADSDGFSGEESRPSAYHYRDWVIEAINNDMPFDRFTIAQLAGDLLPDAGLGEQTAAGFHRNARSSRETCASDEEKHVRAVYDRTIATGEIWLGLTVACVQCHSHKYDPLTQREFFGLYAFFDNLEDVDLTLRPTSDKPTTIPTLRERSDGRRETYVHLRGDYLQRGPVVGPHTFGVMNQLEPRGQVPDRLDLARWIVDEQNPLTARVAVNRIWLHLFGRAIVSTVNDFGTRGEPPSHPELLDWMATEFTAGGWSRKEMIRQIVLSATYRQASNHRADLVARDPENRLLARQNRFRLDGEIIRDAALSVAGRISPAVGGPSFRPPVPADAGAGFLGVWKPDLVRDEDRRSMYIFTQRTVPHPLMASLDVPDGNLPCLTRNRANTPIQALSTMNDPAFFGYAQSAGATLHARGASGGDAADMLFQLALARQPTSGERGRLESLFELAVAEWSRDELSARRVAGIPETDPLPPRIAERAALVLLAQTVMNLDEFLTRE